jgi:lysylphosphatidylglycerol synthetase-like protein (DUF2156 family)
MVLVVVVVVVVAAASKSSDTNKELRFAANFGCFLRAPVVVVKNLRENFLSMAALLLLLLLLDFVVVT